MPAIFHQPTGAVFAAEWASAWPMLVAVIAIGAAFVFITRK